MNIIYMVRDLGVGGISSVVIQNAIGLHNRGHNVLICSLRKCDVDHICGTIKVVSFNFEKKINYLCFFSKFRNVINEFKPDIFHSHHIPTHMLLSAYVFLTRNKKFICVFNQHGTIANTNKQKKLDIIWRFFKIFKPYYSYYSNVSKISADSYIENGIFEKNNTFVLYNSVNSDFFIKNNISKLEIKRKYNVDNGILLGYIGRLSKEKDVANFLRAIKLLCQDRTTNVMKALIIGDGKEKDNLIELSQSLEIDDIVFFLGEKNRNEVQEYLSALDILVLSSQTEGLPMIVLESMSAECMVVSTDCGGIREIFDGLPSFIARVDDSKDLAEKISVVVTLDEDTRLRYGLLYRERILERFSEKVISNDLVKFYSMLMNKE
ncbi:glycosyltransferase [Glaesserella parasuis]|uniref:glycosyltransferase n=1 Tax=Glaesserella parasuis TaxID=738 RepID=UPI0009501AF1|nr:glycosyltransferase [Glaesserella parasuis]MDO9866365.1 glycosyltransferase [Glaesserella parasuis]MDO9904114.1 glycosyltransferase [Glaesserella parasuis]MDO9921330.1 glycosyltransferase [Glaesserella parasuis]MDO9942821.1 glycosyltransferase [Glaesserella parasuis]MDO9998288.1 glycosyltransferase [Glaesserella parasuis]